MIDYTKFHEYEIRDDNGNVVIPGEYSKETYFMNGWTNSPGQIDYIAANLHFLNESLKTLKGEVSYDELKNNIADLTVSLDNRMTALDDKINSLSGSSGVTEDTDLSVALTQLRNEFEEFKRTTNSSISNFDTIYGSKIDSLTDKVNTSNTNNESRIDAAIDAVNSQINSALNEEETGTLQVLLAQSVELLTQKINALQEEIDGLDAVYERKFTNMKLEIMQTVGDELGAAQIRNDEALEDLNFRIDKFSKETEQKLADFSSDFDTKSTELQNRMDSEFSNLNNKYEIIYNDAKTSVENLDSTLTKYKADINTKLDDLKTYAEDSYNELVTKTDNMTSEVRQAIDLTKSEVEDYMDTQLGHEGSDHTVTQEESEDPTSIYYGIPAGTVVVGESTGMFKVIDDTKEELQGKIDDTKNILQGEIDQTRTDVEGKLSETSQELHTQITEMSTDLSNQIDTMDKQYTENISQMGDTLSGRIDTAESTLNQKIEDLTNRVKDTNANASTIQGILSVAMSGQDNVAEVHTRGNSLQLIAGQNNVETIAPYSSSSIEGGRFYTFKLVPNKTYAIATRVKNIAKSNYVTDSIGTSYTGDNNILVTEEGQYPLGYILGDYVTVKDSVVGVVSYNEEILPDSQMVAVIDVTELSNAYISQINMGNGVISLDGKLINITGDTVFNDDAIIKGTMTTGKVEIGDSGVKLDKDGLSIALDNGSTIKYDSTGQHFVDSIGNSFAGIGRFMIGNCSDRKRITFSTPWDIIPNVIMIPMQYTMARAAGTDYEADAVLKCYPTNIDRFGFDPVVYTAITSYNVPLEDGVGTSQAKEYTNCKVDFDYANENSRAFVSVISYEKTDDTTDTWTGLITPSFRGVCRHNRYGSANLYKKYFPNYRISLALSGNDRENIKWALTNDYLVSFDNLEDGGYLLGLAKKFYDEGRDLFEELPHTVTKSSDSKVSMIRIERNGDVYLSSNLEYSSMRACHSALRLLDETYINSVFPDTVYALFVFPEQGLNTGSKIKIGSLLDYDANFDFANYTSSSMRDKVVNYVLGLRGTGEKFEPLALYKVGNKYERYCWSYSANGLTVDGSKLFANSTYDTDWYCDGLKLNTYTYDTVSNLAMCRADYENDLTVENIVSPTYQETAYELEAYEAGAKNYTGSSYDYTTPDAEYNPAVTASFSYDVMTKKMKPAAITAYVRQYNPIDNSYTNGTELTVNEYTSSNIDYFDGQSKVVSLSIPDPTISSLLYVTYRIKYDSSDADLANPTATVPYLDFTIPTSAIKTKQGEVLYPKYWTATRRASADKTNNINLVFSFAKYGKDTLKATSLDTTTVFIYEDVSCIYETVARVDSEKTIIKVDIKALKAEQASLTTESEAEYKSGSAVFIATDASAGQVYSGDEEAELDIKIAEAQATNEKLTAEKESLNSENDNLAYQVDDINNQISAINTEIEEKQAVVNNISTDLSSIETRLNTLIGATE